MRGQDGAKVRRDEGEPVLPGVLPHHFRLCIRLRDQNLAGTVLHVPYSLDPGRDFGRGVPPWRAPAASSRPGPPAVA